MNAHLADTLYCAKPLPCYTGFPSTERCKAAASISSHQPPAKQWSDDASAVLLLLSFFAVVRCVEKFSGRLTDGKK